MAEFIYRAIGQDGREKKGNIKAESMDEVYEIIRRDRMTPVEVKKAGILERDINIGIGGKIKPRDLSVFCRQIVSMLQAGVTIMDSLGMLEEQTENKYLASAIGGAKAEIGKGETLGSALAKFPDVFPDVMVQMVNAGEASGKLDVAFTRMSVYFEKSAKMRGIVKKAATYPIMVAVVAVVVVIIMLVKVIPSYQSMFEDMGTELPKITQAVVAMSDFMIARWYVLLIVIFVIVVSIKAYAATPNGQVFFASLARNMPIFGILTIKNAASSFARMMSTLIYSGLNMTDALGITAGTMTNYLYKKKVMDIKDEVMKGVTMSEPLLSDDMFPSMVGHMAKIGEETGQLEEMLNRLADYYDEEVEMATQTVVAAIEPIVILVLAAVVGTLVAAIMSPMFAMYQSMDNL